MKRIEKIKAMTIEEFVDFIFELDLCVACRESGNKTKCFTCISPLEEREVYKEWLDMEI